jgi:hypothetical protein
MTQDRFNELPLLLRRSDVYECGLTEKMLQVLTVDADRGEVPEGKIGRVRVHKYHKYRKVDVARVIGLKA